MNPAITARHTRPDPQRGARAALTYLAEPGDPAADALLKVCEPAEILAAIRARQLPGPCSGWDPARQAAATRAIGRWRLRLPSLPDTDSTATARPDGIRLLCPGDPEWPARLDDLGPGRPYALWLRGTADLQLTCRQSVSMAGSRAATGYGAHVAGQIAADLAGHGWTILSGGAYGIDTAAHRGALNTGGTTIAVLASGVDRPYPAGHHDLFTAIAGSGLLISEWPPGSQPTRLRFHLRNRVIAALTCGTVIVEAGEHSGALNTARHADDLGRPLMAVPGPVTSAQSAGCHQIIQDRGGALVTGAADILNTLPAADHDEIAPSSPQGTVPPASGDCR